MLKNYILLAIGSLPFSALAATPDHGPVQQSVATDPLNITVPCNIVRPEKPAQSVADTFRPKQRIRRASEKEAHTYRGAFQSFYSNDGTVFEYSGGDFLSYDVTVTIDGNTATLSNLFNLVEGYPFDGSEEFDITGSFDAKTNTITIPTPHQLDSSTRVGIVYGAYPAALICGTVDRKGQMTPEPVLRLQVNEDGTISTTQNFGAMMYDSTGSFAGFKCIYKGGMMSGDLSNSRPVTFTTSIDFGSCYAGDNIGKNIRIFNLGKNSLEASVDIDGDFSLAKNTFTLLPGKTTNIETTFCPETIGDKHGTLSVKCGDKVMNIDTYGHALQMPDYSYLVEEGEMSFYTGASFPFVPYEADGKNHARSDVKETAATSYLRVTVHVSEGKIGTFSWEGLSTSSTPYAIPSVRIDGVERGQYTEVHNKDISGSIRLGEGTHTIEFSYTLVWSTFYSDTDFMHIGSLRFTEETIAANSADLLTPALRFPSSFLEPGSPASKSQFLTLLNTGTQPLKILSVTPTAHFACVELPEPVATLQETNLSIRFEATEAGQYNEDIRVETTAGVFTVPCSALVRDMPDFQSIVASGDFTFETDEQIPFLIENGVAYNSTAKVPDTESTSCTLTARFNVPEGYFGRLKWKGKLDCADIVDGKWSDYLFIGIMTPQQTIYSVACGNYNLDSSLYPYFEEPDPMPLMCTPGDCAVSFTYIQSGDNSYGGADRVEIYDLGLELIEDDEAAIMVESEVNFDPVHVGKSNSKSVTFLNKSTIPLEVYDIECKDEFYGVCPQTSAVFNQYLTVPISFAPTTDGHHESIMTFVTSVGDFDLKVSGDAISNDGIIMLEDFEDDAANWFTYDRDGDGDCWNLAFNVYGGYPQNHVHAGEECVVSFSADYFNNEWRTFRPDNWTLSPSFEVPEQGAWLTWYAAGDNIERTGDRYSVYIGEDSFNPDAPFNFESYKEVATEVLDDTEWHYHKVNLSDFVGKEVHAAFRHHDSVGLYMVKIDDVVVYDYDPAGINPSAATPATPVRILYHSVDGRRLSHPADRGLTIVTTEYDNGIVTSTKILK